MEDCKLSHLSIDFASIYYLVHLLSYHQQYFTKCLLALKIYIYQSSSFWRSRASSYQYYGLYLC